MLYFVYSVCSVNCIDGSCDQYTGACSCQDGYYGADCNNSMYCHQVNNLSKYLWICVGTLKLFYWKSFTFVLCLSIGMFCCILQPVQQTVQVERVISIVVLVLLVVLDITVLIAAVVSDI